MRKRKLNLTRQVRVTEEVYEMLREIKRNQKRSMADIACIAITNEYAVQCRETAITKLKKILDKA